jgi:cold shock CspA family protein
MGRKLLPLLLRIGFGFIKDLLTQESVFIHANKLSEAINEKGKVTFEAETELEGLGALNVKKTSK